MGGAGRHGIGVISVRSPLPFSETIKNLLIAVERRGMILFARIDHAKAAEETARRLRPAELLVFGYPEAEAPLIENVPLLGLDFPQRVLMWEDEDCRVWMSTNEPARLGRRYNVPADVIPKLEAIGASLAGIAAEATADKVDVAGA
jgi:uncharacterized protein (DUF302 family)